MLTYADDCVVTGTQEQRDKAWAIIQEAIDSGQESRLAVPGMLTYAHVRSRTLTYADVC